MNQTIFEFIYFITFVGKSKILSVKYYQIMKSQQLNTKTKTISLESPVVMGILNITPDSFYSASRIKGENKIRKRIEEIREQGAKIIDVGGISTRPGGMHVNLEEEWSRIESVLKILRNEYSIIPVSVDTFRAEIARRSIENYAVDLINDISGGQFDDKMIETVGNSDALYIGMHLKGTFENMHNYTISGDIIQECIDFFTSLKTKCQQAGVKQLIIDPGFGFSKTLDQNYRLLNQLDKLKILELPVLAGLSRKSMIYRFLEITPEESLNGTSVLNTIALQRGAQILRVHDVREAMQTIRLLEKIYNPAVA